MKRVILMGMKRIVYGALVFLMLSCGKSEVERRTEEYCDCMLKAMQEQDYGKLIEVGDEMNEWKRGLSNEERKEVEKVQMRYDEKMREAVRPPIP